MVVTVIVVAMLAVVGVALMQSTSADRAASRSAANILRAKLAAESGLAVAQSMISDLVTRYPDAVTVWQNIGGDDAAGTDNEATVMYVRAQSADLGLGARPSQSGNDVTLLAQPLVSRIGADPQSVNTNLLPLADVVSSVPFDAAASVNINLPTAARPEPFVGSRSTANPGAPVTAAQWIYMTRYPGTYDTNTNPYVARYAFWVEDESFKVNANVATSGARGADSLGVSPSEVRLDGSWGSASDSSLAAANYAAVVLARNGLPDGEFPTALTAIFPAGVDDANAAPELKFLTTVHSAGLDLSRGGFKRFNINTVTDGIAGPADADNIRTSLDRIIAAITNSNSVPNFGQRFYRLSAAPAGINKMDAVTNAHADIYLQKIAANILDYVDGDDQPTYVKNEDGFPVRTGQPDLADVFNDGIGGEGASRVAAMGAETRPFLYGYAVGVKLTDMSPPGYQADNPPANQEAAFTMLVDHYFEFWNPGTSDIVVGAGDNRNVAYFNDIFLQVANAPGWIDRETGARFAPPGTKDFKVQLPNGVNFPAGEITLVTTAPLLEANAFAPEAQNIISLSSVLDPEVRKVTGTTKNALATNSDAFPNFDRFFTVSLDYARCGDAQIDFDTQVLLGTPTGIVELFPALTLYSMRIWARSNNALFTNRTTLFGNLDGANPNGSAPRSAEGDPRTLMEQLELQPYSPGGGANPNQTRLFQNDKTPLGTPNTDYVRPTEWVDYSSFAAGPANAPLFVRNGPLQSIGELGHITDPARVPGAGGALADVKYSRGGGRTLRIGQSEHPQWYDGNQTSASRTWTSWRLADVFTTTATLSVPGLINPNGMLRDNGAALRAALNGLTYLPTPDGAPGLAGKSLDSNIVMPEVIQSFISNLTNAKAAGMPEGALNPFWERGEISQLPIFNSGMVPSDMNATFDRGREELVRRSIEMITTRGSIFTVYALGQTLQGTNVTSTARMKQTFQIEPQFANQDAFDDGFDPSDEEAVKERFKAPDSYTIRVLATSYD